MQYAVSERRAAYTIFVIITTYLSFGETLYFLFLLLYHLLYGITSHFYNVLREAKVYVRKSHGTFLIGVEQRATQICQPYLYDGNGDLIVIDVPHFLIEAYCYRHNCIVEFFPSQSFS